MEIKCCEAEKICYQYILRISRVFSLFFANLLRSDCPFDFSAELRFLKWSVAIHRGPGIP